MAETTNTRLDQGCWLAIVCEFVGMNPFSYRVCDPSRWKMGWKQNLHSLLGPGKGLCWWGNTRGGLSPLNLFWQTSACGLTKFLSTIGLCHNDLEAVYFVNGSDEDSDGSWSRLANGRKLVCWCLNHSPKDLTWNEGLNPTRWSISGTKSRFRKETQL